jgi:hypothetical protein
VQPAAHHVSEQSEARALRQQVHTALRALSGTLLTNLGMHWANKRLSGVLRLTGTSSNGFRHPPPSEIN